MLFVPEQSIENQENGLPNDFDNSQQLVGNQNSNEEQFQAQEIEIQQFNNPQEGDFNQQSQGNNDEQGQFNQNQQGEDNQFQQNQDNQFQNQRRKILFLNGKKVNFSLDKQKIRFENLLTL